MLRKVSAMYLPAFFTGLIEQQENWIRGNEFMAFFKKASTLCIATAVVFSSWFPLSVNAAAAETQTFTEATSAANVAKYFMDGSSASLVDGSAAIKGPLDNVSTFEQLNAGTLPDGTPLTLDKGVFIKSQSTGATGDNDLQAILTSANNSSKVTNISAFEFEFIVPEGKTSVALSFIFASQEDYQSDWDIAGVFVDGVNYALMPNGSILRVNAEANLNGYTSSTIAGWGAWAPPQTLVGLLDSKLQTHKIKIAVANTGDYSVPSGMFISGLVPGNATTGGIIEKPTDAVIAPEAGTFDQFIGKTETGYYHDLSTTLSLNGKTLSGIKLGGESVDVSSYTVDGEQVTFHKEYLSTLELGQHQFTFETDSSVNPVLTVTVTDSTPTVLQSAVIGDGQVNLSWSPVNGADSYKVYVSETSGTYGKEAAASVTGSVYSHTVTDLTNGNTYYFTIKAANAGRDSISSNELSAVPQIHAPDAPVMQSVISGNGEVSLSWDPVVNAARYKVYQSVSSSTYGDLAATVSGDVYSHTVTGLTNGLNYYFVVVAENISGDSPASGVVSSIPATTPAAPTNVVATAADTQATITFTAPADNGGNAIIGYEVTSEPGGIQAAGTGSPIVVKGLDNSITYTFTVKAVNLVGSSTSSLMSNAVTPITVPNVAPAVTGPAPSGTEVLVNGKAVNAGTATTNTVNGQSVLTLALDQQKLDEMISTQGEQAIVTIPVTTGADVVNVELNGQMVKSMENKQVVIQIKTENASYSLPAGQINVDALSQQLGQALALGDIKIRISISTPAADVLKAVEDSAANAGLNVLTAPIDFTVQAVYGDSTVQLSKFNGYVARSITLPEGLDASRITTGIVVDLDGTIRQVPTKVTAENNIYSAEISSLTNSVYTVVYNRVAFADVENHWAKDAVNDFGSRLIISGLGGNSFMPDQDITRAEFASIVVKALGLKPEDNTSSYTDVKTSDWYSGAIETARAYKLISGYADGSFHPEEKITREQAMTIIAKAMELTGLKNQLATHNADAALGAFADAGKVAEWAKNGVADGLQAGLINGRSSELKQLAPKASMTRAEVAVILQRLLQKSNLI